MDCQGPPGTARVMSHEVKRIGSGVYDLNPASRGGPSPRNIAPYSPPGPHLPGRSPSLHPKKTDYSRSPSRPHPKTDGLDGWEH